MYLCFDIGRATAFKEVQKRESTSRYKILEEYSDKVFLMGIRVGLHEAETNYRFNEIRCTLDSLKKLHK
jgi:hypothetical protein